MGYHICGTQLRFSSGFFLHNSFAASCIYALKMPESNDRGHNVDNVDLYFTLFSHLLLFCTHFLNVLKTSVFHTLS